MTYSEYYNGDRSSTSTATITCCLPIARDIAWKGSEIGVSGRFSWIGRMLSQERRNQNQTADFAFLASARGEVPLILRWPPNGLNEKDIDRPLSWLQFQAELLLQGCED